MFGLFIAYVFAAIFIFLVLRQFHSKKITAALVAIFIGVSIAFYVPHGMPTELAYPLSLQSFGPGERPDLPVRNVVNFFQNFSDFERVENIAKDPADLPKSNVYAENGAVSTSSQVSMSLAKYSTVSTAKAI